MAFTRPNRLNKNRRRTQPSLQYDGVIPYPTAVHFTTPAVQMVFPVPVVLSGLPTWLTDTGKIPVSAVIASDKLSVTCTYDTPGSVTEITVSQADQSIRSFTGGRVPPGTFPAD